MCPCDAHPSFFLHINAPFLDIFGCARQYEQALLHSLARKFALRFSAALGNMSKLYCTRLHENWLRLGIIQVNLASALALHKRSYKMHLWRRLGIVRPNKFVGLCSRLAQTFVFNSPLLDWSSIRRLCFTCFSAPSVLLFQRVFPLPHNCGAAAPQLWGNDDKGDQNNYLACRNNYKGEKIIL